MVLGPSPLEDPTVTQSWRRAGSRGGLIGRRRRVPWGPGRLAAVASGGLLVAALGLAWAEMPPVDRDAVQGGLGPPGLLWGRLAAEEESPDGPWTPLAGVEVTVYPHVPGVVTELERIRDSARDSVRLHDTAARRLKDALAVYQARVTGEPASTGTPARPAAGGASGGAGAEPGEGGLVRRRLTDPTGVFAFANLPSGEWVLVAVRVAPYQTRAGPASGARQDGSRRGEFLGRQDAGPAAQAMEMWVARVRVAAGQRVQLELSDRARWFTGPLR